MAYIIANKDGSSNARIGDRVVTGGGVFEKMADGSSRKIDSLPTLSGKTSSYTELQNIFSRMSNAMGNNGGGSGGGGGTPDTPELIQIAETPWNDDFFQGEYLGGSDLGGGSLDGSTIVGYIVVAMVGIVVLDRMMGK